MKQDPTTIRKRRSSWPLSQQPLRGTTFLFLEVRKVRYPSKVHDFLERYIDKRRTMVSHVSSLFLLSGWVPLPCSAQDDGILFRRCFVGCTCEKMRKLDGQDDSLLERLLGCFQSCNIRPLDIWFFREDGRLQCALQLFCVCIVLVLVVAILFPARWKAEVSVSVRVTGCQLLLVA